MTGYAISRRVVLAGAGVVVLLLAVTGCVPGGLWEPASSVASRWDDFQRPDGLLVDPARRALPSGQQWQVAFAPGPGAGPSSLRLAGGALRYDAPGAAYAWTTADRAPTAATVDFRYEPGSSPVPASGVGLIVSPRSGPAAYGPDGVASNSVHAAFGVDRWSIGIADGVRLDVIASGSYQLDADGRTSYRATLRRVGEDTVEVDTPDGGTHTVTDDRIPRYWGAGVLIEHYQPIGQYQRDPRPVVVGYRVDGGG